jgi:hypothetical protein
MCKFTRALLAALLAMSIVMEANAQQPSMAADAPLGILPLGWSLMGNGGPLALPGRCDIGIDNQMSRDGPQVYSIHCTSNVLPSFAGARTSFDVAPYRGKRVRVSASLMAADIEHVPNAQYPDAPGEAGLWIGVGSPQDGLRTSRMPERTIKGSTGWETRDFVVDIPADANQLQAGYWMQGMGQFWMRDLKVEEVPLTVAVNWDRNEFGPDAMPDTSLAPATAPLPTDRFLPPPRKWLALGESNFELCDAGIDAVMLSAGQRNLSIACQVPVRAFLRQAFVSAPWWGKRVRLSAWIKTENVVPREGDFGPVGMAVSGARGAALYLATSDTIGPLYNIVVTGTTDWTYHELVLDIPAGAAMPAGAKYLPMGLSLNGTGQVWVRDLKFEEVPRDTPLSQIPAQGFPAQGF